MKLDLKYKRLEEIVSVFMSEEDVTVDLLKLARELGISVIEKAFQPAIIENEEVLCAFVTNKSGNSCIFYSSKFLEDKDFIAGRLAIVSTFVKHIVTGENSFVTTNRTTFSPKEQQLIYELLMPEKQVRVMCNKLLLPTTYALANIFSVSQEFVRARLDAMGMNKNIAGYNY